MRRRNLKKHMLLTAGLLSLGLGATGIFLPVLPTTPFLLISAACFMRSSDRLYEWLLTNRWCGSYIRNYRENKAITMRTKTVTLVLLWGTIGYTAFGLLSSWALRTLLLVMAAGVTVHVMSFRTLR